MNLKGCKLIEICAEIKDDFCELAAEGISTNETPYINWDGDFEDYLRRMHILAKGENLPADEVPRNTYFLFCGGKIIGRSEIRTRLTPELEIRGHIGADIRRSERKKGYGTLILMLTLEKARELGLKKVLVGCNKQNVPSAKTIEKCGGILEKQVTSGESGTISCLYWIEL
ncbi:MAG: GNAT family N-acetyltransferase [Acidobacteriota bacterium]|nr:GNAT family N-acetyltransferase [Acidobacteriota bacterium]